MQHAKNLAESIVHDPQMQMPTHPRISEDYLKIWHNRQTLIIFGGLSDVVLRGNSVANLLPQLLPLLTGKYTISQIAERVQGFRPNAVEDALSLLYMQGLLEEGTITGSNLTRDMLRDFAAQLKLYSRYIDQTRISHNRYEVLSRLQSSSVLLFGEGDAARQMLHELMTLGLGQVTLVALDEAAARWGAINSPYTRVNIIAPDIQALNAGDDAAKAEFVELADNMEDQNLILLATSNAWLGLTRTLNQLGVEHQLPFLRARLSQEVVEVGPTVFPNQSGSYECIHLQGLLNLDDISMPKNNKPGMGFLSAEEQIGASQTAMFVLANLTKFIPIKTGETMYRLAQDTLLWEPQAIHRLAGCPGCFNAQNYDCTRDLMLGPNHAENWPVMYHINTNDRMYNLFPKGHQMHYSPRNMKTVEGAYKEYHSRERIELPKVDALPQAFMQSFTDILRGTYQAPQKEKFTLEDVTMLLGLAAGRQVLDANTSGWRVGLRLTPSAGGLASQTLYLVNFQIDGLAQGIYHYNPNNALEVLRRGDFRSQLDQVIFGSEALSESKVVAAIIETTAFGRVESKYLNKSYRYTLYDAGAMLYSLQMISQMIGLELWQAPNFYDDELTDLLNIFTITEPALYVTYLVAEDNQN